MKKPAQATLAIVVALATILITVSVLVSTISYTHFLNQQSAVEATQSLLLADSALENALLMLQQEASYTGETFSVPEGQATISVINTGSTSRTLTVTTQNLPVRRSLDIDITISGYTNPNSYPTIFGGDDVFVYSSSALVEGGIWTNDNVDVRDSAIVRGNILAAGQGALTSTQIRYSGRVEDYAGSLEIEGNVYSIDRIRVNNSGSIQNRAESRTGVTIATGGSVGSSVTNPSLTIPTYQIPSFDYDEVRTIAQLNGTYFANAAQFISYLALNGNTTPGGIFYIDGTDTLTFAQGQTYNITGSIVSESAITINSESYTHIRDSYYPVIVSGGDVRIEDPAACNCSVNIGGVIFSERSVILRYDQYSGAESYAAIINGGIVAADEVWIREKSRVILDLDALLNTDGFNTSGVELPPDTDNIISIEDWGIE